MGNGTKRLWYCVVNTEGTVLAVYGAQLKHIAEEKAAEINNLVKLPGVSTVTEVFTNRCPKIGTKI